MCSPLVASLVLDGLDVLNAAFVMSRRRLSGCLCANMVEQSAKISLSRSDLVFFNKLLIWWTVFSWE